jgi:hypothetical protein
MQTHYFTFGQTHCDPQTGEKLKDYWVEVYADNANKAREKMFEIFGGRWGFHYCERQFMKHYAHFPKGCYARYEVD